MIGSIVDSVLVSCIITRDYDNVQNVKRKGASSHSLLSSSFGLTQGATVQVTYYNKEKKFIYSCSRECLPPDAIHISGSDVLSNAQVNVVSIMITSACGAAIGSAFF